MKETAMESELKCVFSGFLCEVRYAILFDIVNRILRFNYQRFGTTYWIHLEESRIRKAKYFFDFFIFEVRIAGFSRNVGNKLQLYVA